jgi:hypothetical protein
MIPTALDMLFAMENREDALVGKRRSAQQFGREALDRQAPMTPMTPTAFLFFLRSNV